MVGGRVPLPLPLSRSMSGRNLRMTEGGNIRAGNYQSLNQSQGSLLSSLSQGRAPVRCRAAVVSISVVLIATGAAVGVVYAVKSVASSSSIGGGRSVSTRDEIKLAFPQPPSSSSDPCDVGLDDFMPTLPGAPKKDGPCTPPSQLDLPPSLSEDGEFLGQQSASDQDCSVLGENCAQTQCCSAPGTRCYEKNSTFAACRQSCQAGLDPADADATAWTCRALGDRAAGWAPKCSAVGEDCSSSQCCQQAGAQCYKKNDGWATCKATCTAGVDLLDSDWHPWSCEKLGTRTPVRADWVPARCAKTGENCAKAQCCADFGMQCFGKDTYWAECKATCAFPWNCQEFGLRTPSAPALPPPASTAVADWVSTCAAEGGDCSKKNCCSTPGTRCFEKNSSFASCRKECVPGPHLGDPDWHAWSCKALSPTTPGGGPVQEEVAAPWDPAVCSSDMKDCSETKCCATPGLQCYSKNSFWAQCMPSCKGRLGWSCKELGSRAPVPTTTESRSALPPVTTRRPDLLPNWLALSCSVGQENCIVSRCCVTRGHQCFAKNATYARCQPTCAMGQDKEPWSCEELGFRVPTSTSTSTVTTTSRTSTTVTTTTITMSTSTTTTTTTVMSVFCFAVTRKTGYEADVIYKQHVDRIGIFACDSTAVLCTERWQIAKNFEAIQFKAEEVGVSDVGFAANAKLFNNAWQAIKDDGRYVNFDWTIKVDPDAVLMPNRLWKHLSQHTGKATYVNNCGMFKISAMYGSLEALTKEALVEFFDKVDDACNWMLWRPWGEDLYLQKCLKQIGVEGVTELGVISDQRCWDSALPDAQGCKDAEHPAFHPLKSMYNWTRCWNETVQAEGQELRERVLAHAARWKTKATRQVDQKERAVAWRKAQLVAGKQRRDEEEKRRAAKAKQYAAAKAAKERAAKAELAAAITIGTELEAVGSRLSMDDTTSSEYASALAKSNIVKKLLRVGDTVQVRDVASQRWRPGNVTSTAPVTVTPKGWTVGFEWDIVDLIPFDDETDFVSGDRVVVAPGHESAPDVREGPLRPGGVGVVQERREAVASGEVAVLVEVEGQQWWYRASSIVQETPVALQTCKVMGCQVAAAAVPTAPPLAVLPPTKLPTEVTLPSNLPMMEAPVLPGTLPTITVKKRRLRADFEAFPATLPPATLPTAMLPPATLPPVRVLGVRETCRCGSDCVSAGRCCSDFVDTCIAQGGAVMSMQSSSAP